MSKVDPARDVAFDVLTAVREQDSYANLTLPPLLRARSITGRDAAFATELVSGTLRRQGTYDAILAANIKRQLGQVDAAVLDALRLGTHQLLGMRVPAHAAVGTTVQLVRDRVGRGPAGFANAVLRSVSAHDLDGWIRRVAPDPSADPAGYLSVAHSHPRWIIDAFTRSLSSSSSSDSSAVLRVPAAGESQTNRSGAEDVEALLAADNAPPRVTLAALPGCSTVEELVAAGGTASDQSSHAVILESGGDPGAVPAVREGRARVQDEGSQLVAAALAAAPLEGRDERWLDLCAGPGGKSALLAALAGDRSAGLLSVERASHRADLVASAVRAVRSGMLGVVCADGTRPAWPDGSFDRVLVDAPCSGLGALRRRPEARWRRTAADLDQLVPLQTALLRSALEAVRPGGLVAYVTCSPVLEETSGVVSAVLAERTDVQLADASGLFPGVRAPFEATLPGTVQLWPHRHGTDAMFLALLRRDDAAPARP